MSQPTVLPRRHGADLVTRQVGEETLVVPVRGEVDGLDALYVLDEVGALLWSRLDGQTELHEMVALVTARYDVDAARAEADIRRFVASLDEAGLLAPRAEPAEAAAREASEVPR